VQSLDDAPSEPDAFMMGTFLLLGLRRSRSACAGALTILSACSSGSSPVSSGAPGTDAASVGPGDATAQDTGSTPGPDASRGDAAGDGPQGVGLSSSYPGDMGIAQDPAVVWAELFDEGSITAFTQEPTHINPGLVQPHAPLTHAEPCGDSAQSMFALQPHSPPMQMGPRVASVQSTQGAALPQLLVVPRHADESPVTGPSLVDASLGMPSAP